MYNYNKLLSKIKRKLKIKKKINDQEKVKWAIIGLGTMAEWFANALEAVPDATITAVASRDIEKARRFGRKHSVNNTYGNYADMLKDENLDIDIIYIATPHKYHYEHIKMCLENGQNVICEKPITSNTKELTQLMKLAKKKQLFLMEGMWMKCLPTYQKALEWVNEGKIGDIECIRVDLSKNELVDENKSIFKKNEGGGVLLDYGIYALTFPLAFMSESTYIKSFYSRRNSKGIDRDWNIILNDSNIKAFITISSNFEGDKKAVIIGTKGTIEWMPQFNRANYIKLFDENGKLVDSFKKKYIVDGFEYEIREVHTSLRNCKYESDIVPLSSSLKTFELIDILINN